jgi:hypothetical protein
MMNLSQQDLNMLDSDRVYLKFSQTDLQQAEPVTQAYSNQTARNNAYLNRLCLNSFVAWLREYLDLDNSSLVLPSEADLVSNWEVVNGSAIALGNTRIVLIPSEALDTEEFAVPQEWVDIPNWAADYYLAVQVDLDKHWMHIWGYTTHQTLKAKGNYDPIYRTYSLDRDYTIADLDILWVAKELCKNEREAIAALPALSSAEASSLVDRLAKPSPYFPRLEVPFAQWGALLSDDKLRQQLYEQRNEQAKLAANPLPARALVSLGQWLQNEFNEAIDAGWQALESVFGAEQPGFAFAFRNTAQIEETSIKRGKRFDLAARFGRVTVVMLLALKPELDGKVGLMAQVRPYGSDTYLPAHLKLILLSVSGAKLQEVEARSHDNFIQFPALKLDSGTRFSIQMAIDDNSVTENFVADY